MTDANRREQEAEGFPRDVVSLALRASDPARYWMVETWPEDVRADVYDRLGRAWAAAFDRAILYGTEVQRQARTRALVRECLRANKGE